MKKLLQQALDALEPDNSAYREERVDRAINALRAAIAQPESEPVAWVTQNGSLVEANTWECPSCPELEGWAPLYAAPVPSYVPLTDGEIIRMWMDANKDGDTVNVFARAIERAVRGEK